MNITRLQVVEVIFPKLVVCQPNRCFHVLSSADRYNQTFSVINYKHLLNSKTCTKYMTHINILNFDLLLSFKKKYYHNYSQMIIYNIIIVDNTLITLGSIMN